MLESHIKNVTGEIVCKWVENVLGVRGRERSYQIIQHLTCFIGSTCSSALSLVFKTIPRAFVADTFEIVWVLGWLWSRRV